MRVFIGPHEIAGYYGNLTRGLKKLGVDVDFITLKSHPFGYGGETVQPTLLRAAAWFDQYKAPGRGFFQRVAYSLPGKLLRAIWLLKVIFSYDVFIFGFGQSLLPFGLDLPLLRAFGKKVITNLSHGSEARPPFMNGYLTNEGAPISTTVLFQSAKKIARVVDWHFKYCTLVIGAPFGTSQYARGCFINHFSLGLPFEASEVDNVDVIDGSTRNDRLGVIRILHSPSHPAAKGSPAITSAIESLKNKGYVIDFVLIHGRPFREVLEEVQKCDFVIDQIYNDTPMAGFATEAAWFGKPAVVAGYGFDRLKQFVPEGMWPPSMVCHPDEIEQVIEKLVVDSAKRKQLGSSAQAFVRQKWSSVEVAKRYLRLIEGDIPKEWWLNPKDIVYVDGAGQPVVRTKHAIRELVSLYGVSSLQLSHRPDLQAAFLAFAGVEASGLK